MKTAEEIAALYTRRRMARGEVLKHMEEIRTAYNGDMIVPLPELDDGEKPAVANLIVQGVDQMAMRIASVMPDISYPPLRSGIQSSEDKARNRRLANLAWWDMNKMPIILRQRARYLLAYGHAPVTISRVSAATMDKREMPYWRSRNPFSAFLPAPETENDMEPATAIFCHQHTRAWLEEHYPTQMRGLQKGDTTLSDRFEVLEYMDATEHVLVVLGKAPMDDPSSNRDPYGRPQTRQSPGKPHEVLVRVPNRAGIPLVVAPGRITLDRVQGMFDMLPGMYHRQSKLEALLLVSLKRSIFPDEWLITHPTSPTSAEIVTSATAMRGIRGEIRGGQIQTVAIQPSQLAAQGIDMLERNQRVTGGIPAEFGGESPTNIRTARRGEAVMASTITMPIGEAQDVFAASLEAEDVRAIALMRAWHRGKSFSFYQSRTGPTPHGNDYSITADFETDMHFVKYSIPGADAAAIPIEIGQRVGTGEMSLQTAREMDPVIEDPIRERDQVEVEGLRKALLTGLEQQAAQGALSPALIAQIAKAKLSKEHPSIEDAVIKVHEEAQRQQAAAGGGTAAAQPGAGPQTAPTPPGANEPQQTGATIPPPNLSGTHLRSLLHNLRSPSAQSAPEKALT